MSFDSSSYTCGESCAACAITGHQVYVLGKLRIDLDRIEARVDGRRLNLAPQEFRLVSWFVRHPNVIHAFETMRQDVLPHVFGAGYADEQNSGSLRALICRVRKKIGTGAGVPDLESRYGFGYGLMLDELSTVAA